MLGIQLPITDSSSMLFCGWLGVEPPPWRDLPQRFGNWNSVYRRFRRWAVTDVWRNGFDQLQEPDLDWLMIDATVVRAHQYAAGQKKATPPANG